MGKEGVAVISREDMWREMDLYGMPANYQFTDEEIDFLKSLNPKRNWRVKYAVYKKKSYKNAYIGFLIDQEPYATRRSAVMNNWQVICERELCDVEYQEQIENFGTNHRRFEVWMYRDIEALIADDKRYDIETPEEFVDLCKSKGYSGNYQMIMEF